MLSQIRMKDYIIGQNKSIETENKSFKVKPMKGFSKWVLYPNNKKLYLYSKDKSIKSYEEYQLEFDVDNQELSLDSVYIGVKPGEYVAVGETFKVRLVLDGSVIMGNVRCREWSNPFRVDVVKNDIDIRKSKDGATMPKGTEERRHSEHAMAETKKSLPMTALFVLNNVNCLNGEIREESLGTTEYIIKTFSQISNCHIEVLINVPKYDIFKDTNKFFKYRKYDQIVMLIMSHGDLDHVFLTDGKILQTAFIKKLVEIINDETVRKVVIFSNCLRSPSIKASEAMRRKLQDMTKKTPNLRICYACEPGEASHITSTRKKEDHNLYIHTLLKRLKTELESGRIVNLEHIIEGTEERVPKVDITTKNAAQVVTDEKCIIQKSFSEGILSNPFYLQKKSSAEDDRLTDEDEDDLIGNSDIRMTTS